ncbi:hypothetical protein Poli38472_010057 [Pythium oligandrum]|uniref:Uncharacterized protein n=1 Tax=Pythium oligandrum TaxID=41045 RepID=A0A8K1FH75_PYTOL|nr:hypothetical protein Poli38472_010057 [Pythium oligandrum]|eukprot:TMW58498.1 hypothetical protein Poli38472_010057 [Pythium oligandrum]
MTTTRPSTASVGFLASLNPLGLLQDARQLTLAEFLRDFYTQRGLHYKLKDVESLVSMFERNLPQLYAELDKTYGTVFLTNPPPISAPSETSVSAAVPTSPAVSTTPRAASKPPVNKIIMLGNSGVGKTNLLNRLNKGDFNEEFTSTIGVEFLTHVVPIDGVDVKAQIWDTAGQERFHAMMATYYRKAIGALLIFDLGDRNSLMGVEKWLDQLLNVAEPGLHAVLVGNKSDLPIGQRAVTKEEAQQFATAHHMSYVETSAKTGENVEFAFHSLIKSIHRTQLSEKQNPALQQTAPASSTLALTGKPQTEAAPASFFGDGCKFL